MSPPDDERRPGQGGGSSSSSLARQLHPTPQRRRPPLRHAWGEAHLVTARSGRESLTITVFRCPYKCGHAHRHTAPPDFFDGIRTAGCGGGRFVLHAYLEKQAVA